MLNEFLNKEINYSSITRFPFNDTNQIKIKQLPRENQPNFNFIFTFTPNVLTTHQRKYS